MAASLKGRVALITGSTQGIGLGMLQGLARAGADVVMHGLVTPEQARQKQAEIEGEYGVKCGHSAANVMKPAEIREMIQRVQQDFGRLDILVNNVGIQYVSPVHTFPEDKWDAIIAVCLSSAFHSTKAALPAMLEAKWGRIINTGSMHALVASPYKSAYNAAKHGIAGFTKTVALETAQAGNVTCNAICPGYVLTDLIRNQLEDTAKARGIPKEKVVTDVLLADQPTKRFVKVEEIAALVRHLCSDDAASITGACLSIDGGWTAR
ncbi:3-hydroxybutyrate dehydrogenase [Coccomyxa subellipsoidea C-169]|uniref:3-oxoacyl-[acyl-carrier-protein] reductase n=1 Tax=Coccomyxa subellipsoidea (strain C-169) TaxID=574566 RepID=I0Z696_COCSC|nr:3-hydroxybutyrate dehydrogenase [Coccomyxa subellipsoidea C-169]EIE26165.1 3-hydroxybutyrate dehydrogenase [Coccomyxa subellipsoidea C-169]|eukprot:XP_005650709.1 3-hydroxybutyrate dehydrogenase [Coccomyxa subellipsoidea C-169]